MLNCARAWPAAAALAYHSAARSARRGPPHRPLSCMMAALKAASTWPAPPARLYQAQAVAELGGTPWPRVVGDAQPELRGQDPGLRLRLPEPDGVGVVLGIIGRPAVLAARHGRADAEQARKRHGAEPGPGRRPAPHRLGPCHCL